MSRRPSSKPAVIKSDIPAEGKPGGGSFQRTFVIVVLSSFLSLVCVYWLCVLIHAVYAPDVAKLLSEAAAKAVAGNAGFRPEPVERTQFVLSLLSLPFLLLLFQSLVKWFISDARRCFSWIYFAALLGSAALIYRIFSSQSANFNSEISNFAFFHATILGTNTLLSVLSIPLSALLLRLSIDREKLAGVLYAAVAACIMCFLFVLNVCDADTYSHTYGDLNAVMYPISQVVHGRTLLVHLTSQYGLYPEAVGPIFKLIGLSVRSFSVLFTALTCAAFLCGFLFLWKVIKNKLIALFAFSSVFFLCYLNVNLGNYFFESYFQYSAVRLLAPCLLCLMAYLYAREKRLLPVLAAVNSLAFYWNSDTGFVCLLSSFLYVLYLQISEDGRIVYKELALLALKFAAIFAAATGLVFAYLFVKSGQVPSWSLMFKSQAIFYGAGFFMLPMPKIHFWWLVVIMYTFALGFALHKLFSKTATRRDSLYFLLSILGFGVFSYYQGRSHDFVLTAVYYPAIFILGMACDDLLGTVRAFGFKEIDYKTALGAALFLILSVSFYSLFTLAEFINVYVIIKAPNVSDESAYALSVKRNIGFIKENFKTGEPVLILVKNFESVYYAECGLVNPVNVPSSTEWILKEDVETVKDYVKRNKTQRIIYDIVVPLSSEIQTILIDNYEVTKDLKDGSLLILSPKGLTAKRGPGTENAASRDIRSFSARAESVRNQLRVARNEKQIKSKPGDPGAYFNLGNIYSALGKPDKAIPRYLDVLRLDPGYWQAHYNLASVLLGQGKLDEARAHYEAVLRLNPDFAGAHNNLGIILRNDRSKFPAAIEHFRAALRLNPGFWQAHYNLAFVFINQGRPDEAVPHLEAVVRLNPGDAAAHRNLGFILDKQGRRDAAIEHFKAALRIDPNDASSRESLARMLRAQPAGL